MKTTIKTGTRQIVVEPSKTRRGSLMILVLPDPVSAFFGMAVILTQDQAGALIFALEQAAEAAQMAQKRSEFGLVGTRDSVQAMEDRLAA